jgi:hypothetical protein
MNETTNPAGNFPVPAGHATVETGSGLSETARLIDTFVAPSKTFTDILRSSSWWLPFLVSVLISFAFFYAVEQKVGWPQVVNNVLKQTPKQQERFADMEATQASQAKHQMAAGYRYFAWGSPVLALLIAALCASVLLATLNFGFGGEATFGRMFAVWMYGTLPLSLKAVLATIILFAGMDPEGFNLQNPAGTNLGYYLPTDMNKGIITLATSVDILTIWSVILLVIGCSIVAKVSRTSAAISVVGWWAIVALASVAGAIVNS